MTAYKRMNSSCLDAELLRMYRGPELTLARQASSTYCAGSGGGGWVSGYGHTG